MTRPEFSPEPPTGPQREKTQDEKVRAAKRLRNGIDALLLRHFEDVETTMHGDLRTQSVSLAFRGVNSDYNIIVNKNSITESKLPENYILLITDSPRPGSPYEAEEPTEYDYTLDETGEIKRITYNVNERVRRWLERSDGESPNTLYPFSAEALAESVEHEEQLINFEESFGLQNQVVGYNEVDEVLRMAEKGELMPVTFQDLYRDHDQRLVADEVGEDEGHRGSVFFIETVKAVLEANSEVAEVEPFGDNGTDTYVVEGDDAGELIIQLGRIDTTDGEELYYAKIDWLGPTERIMHNFGAAHRDIIDTRTIISDHGGEPLQSISKLGVRDARRVCRFLTNPVIEVPSLD